MTDNVTAAVPPTAGAPRRYTESLSLFIDPATRAYTLGRAVQLAAENNWPTLRESEVLRGMIDAAIQQDYDENPEGYARVMAAGAEEMERRREIAKESRQQS